MPKTKISEYSATNSANTDIEGINIDEGCPPSSINNAIREVMVHLKEFQTGASGDAFTFAGGTLMSGTNTISGAAVISGNINSSGTTNTFSGGNIFSGTNTFSGTNIFSSDVTLNAQKDLRFADSDSSNWVAFQSPATVASNVTWTLPATDGTSNQALVTNGSGTLSWATASASPGGSTTQLQYNNAGAFGGISGVTSDGTRITASTTIGVGGATPSTSGSGISFPATASASSDANTLDDYEEGTFTPAIDFGGASVAITYSDQLGFYTKIGNLVTCQIRIVLSSKGTSSGDATITGLPFTAASGGAYSGVAGRISSMTFADTYGGFVNIGTSFIILEEVTNAGVASSLTNSDFTNGTNIILTTSYRV
jgi:hypothetical protein